jgi:hypothetical protein
MTDSVFHPLTNIFPLLEGDASAAGAVRHV